MVKSNSQNIKKGLVIIMTTREILDSYTQEEGISLFNSVKSEKEVYDLFVEKGLTDSFETYLAETEKIANEKLSQMSREELLARLERAELSDEQLEAVSGGCDDPDVVEKTVPVAGVLTVTGAVSAAML